MFSKQGQDKTRRCELDGVGRLWKGVTGSVLFGCYAAGPSSLHSIFLAYLPAGVIALGRRRKGDRWVGFGVLYVTGWLRLDRVTGDWRTTA